jgi:hypothetical protein
LFPRIRLLDWFIYISTSQFLPLDLLIILSNCGISMPVKKK